MQTPLLAVVPAFLIAAAVLVALTRPWLKGAAMMRPAWGGALALALAFITADCLIWHSRPMLWSVEEQRRLWIVAVGAVVAAALNAVLKDKVVSTWRAWVAGAVLMLPLVWSDATRAGAYPPFAVRWLLYAGAAAILWAENAAAAKRVPGIRVPLVLTIAAAGAGLTIIQSSSASIGFMAIGLASATGAFIALAIWRPSIPAIVGAMPVFAALFAGLFVGALYGGVDIRLWSFIFAICASATPAIGGRGPLAKVKPWMATLVCVILTCALIALAIWNTPKGFDFSVGGPGA